MSINCDSLDLWVHSKKNLNFTVVKPRETVTQEPIKSKRIFMLKTEFKMFDVNILYLAQKKINIFKSTFNYTIPKKTKIKKYFYSHS